MTDQEAIRKELKAMVDKGQRSLESAQAEFHVGNFDFASSKAYYAVFHLMQAALLSRGLSYSKHAGVASGFSEQFVKSGIFPRDFGAWVQRLRRDREIGDYGYEVRVSEEDAKEDIRLAQEIVRVVEEYLGSFLR